MQYWVKAHKYTCWGFVLLFVAKYEATEIDMTCCLSGIIHWLDFTKVSMKFDKKNIP